MRAGVVKVVAGLVLAGIGLATSVYFLNNRAIESLMKEDSMIKSAQWTARLVKNLPNVEGIANGTPPSREAMQYLNFVAGSQDVDHFDLYNKSGDLLLESKNLARFGKGGVSLGQHNPEVLEVVESGKPFVVIEEEVEDGKTEILAETYLPIMKDGKMVGVASVYIDQTDLAANLKRKFTLTSLVIGGLSAIGFAVPALGAALQLQRRRKADAQVAYLARHDVLTDLPNRRTMESELQGQLDACGKAGTLAVLHFIDIDFFKELNDRYGHSFGDEVLKAFAQRLKECLRLGDHASRFGGDEFLFVQSGFNSIEDLAVSTQKLMAMLAKPFTVLDKTIVVTSSVGTAMYPANGERADALMHSADIALYVVKTRGRNGQRFFEPEYVHQKKRRAELEMLIREHAAAKTFELHYQPLLQLDDRSLKGFEALLRMKNHDGSYISPAEFVPVAEDIGLIDDIGAWVLEEACKQAALWPGHVQISVNLSPVQFRRKSVRRVVRAALDASGIAPERLILEVTESLLMSEVDGVLDQLGELKQMGCGLAMDDFGTGYSSLSYIMQFPFDRIKIDRSFVKQLGNEESKGHKLVQTIVALGHTMEMAVTAEGVESASQASALRGMNCDAVQGFFYSKPVPAADLAALILRNYEASISADGASGTEESAAIAAA